MVDRQEALDRVFQLRGRHLQMQRVHRGKDSPPPPDAPRRTAPKGASWGAFVRSAAGGHLSIVANIVIIASLDDYEERLELTHRALERG